LKEPTKLQAVLAGLALAAFMLLAVPNGNAATLTFSDPSCSGFVLSGTAPNQTLVCNTTPGAPPPPGGTPPPPPPPTPTWPGLERFDSVPGDSDWARWQFWQSSEFAPLQARLVQQRGWSPEDAYARINRQINAYQSTIKVQGVRSGTGNTYQCVTGYTLWGTPVFTSDVNGACDAYVQARFPDVLGLGELR
jgi:hypothetical protein